jgi:hypothetical protein
MLLAILCPVIDAEDDHLIHIRVHLVNNDVGQSLHRPFQRAGHDSDMPNMRKFREAFSRRADTPYRMSGRIRIALMNVVVNCRDLGRRVKRLA